MDAAGFDFNTGFGFIDAVGAIYKVWKPEPPQLVVDTGAPQTDGLINLTQPTFTGTVPAGSFVEIFAGGGRIAFEQLPPGETTYTLQSARTLRNNFTYDIKVRVSENESVPVANRS